MAQQSERKMKLKQEVKSDTDTPAKRKQARLWREASTRANRKRGVRSFTENKECAQYLGVHIAERVLSHVFKDVRVMPNCNQGYDFICNKGMKIDVKSSCQTGGIRWECGWSFNIRHNTIADHFLCLAFDNREDLNPMHAWLLPGGKFNHLMRTSISPSTIHKWDAYMLDISRVSECCNIIRGD